MKRKSLNRNHYGYLYVLPLCTIICAVLVFPIAKVALMSIQDYYMIRPDSVGAFVGLQNYKTLFSDKNFQNSIAVSIKYILVTVPARFLLGLGSALLLNKKFKGRAIARAFIIIPWAVPEVVACLVWILMYDKDFGIINALLQRAGLIKENIGWLLSTDYALGAAMVVNIWKGFPFVAVMLLSGMQSIPGELYEASRVDGSNAWHRFRYITWPLLQPVVMVVFLLLVIWTIRDFGIVYVLAKGGPSRATEVLPIYLYTTAFKNMDFGIASAAGMVMLAVALIFAIFYVRALQKGGTEI